MSNPRNIEYQAAIEAAWARKDAEIQEIEAEFWFGPKWEDEFWAWQESRPPEIVSIIYFGFDSDGNDLYPGQILRLKDWDDESRIGQAIRNFSASAAAFLRHILRPGK